MCGITGVFAPGRDAARLAFFALYALQHRGQESAGIAAADGGTIRSHKEMGLLSAIFDEDVLGELSGHIAIGHTRYSTSGSSIVVNAQPLLERTELGDFAFAHNGNLTNTDELRETLSPTTVLTASSDSEVMAKLIVEAKGSMLDRIRHVLVGREGRVLDRALHARRALRVSRSVGRAADVPRQTQRRRLRRRVGIVGARTDRRAVRARNQARRDPADLVRRARVGPDADRRCARSAVHVRIHLLRAARFALERTLDLHGALRDGASAGARISRGCRRRDGRAGLGRSRARSATLPKAVCRTSKG